MNEAFEKSLRSASKCSCASTAGRIKGLKLGTNIPAADSTAEIFLWVDEDPKHFLHFTSLSNPPVYSKVT